MFYISMVNMLKGIIQSGKEVWYEEFIFYFIKYLYSFHIQWGGGGVIGVLLY